MTRKKKTTRGDSALHDDWGLFGRPLFEDSAARDLSRVGVVDVGSNSVRMVVFDGAARSPAYFFNEKIMCALGSDLPETGRLSVVGRARALSAIRRFQQLAKGMGLEELTAVATAAVREAEDGPGFCAEVLVETGLTIQVIDGLEEARLSAQGVLLGWPTARGLVCDIGGSSMELAEVSEDGVGQTITSSLGPQNLKAVSGGMKGLKAHIKAGVEDLRAAMPKDYERIYLVGGSWRAIARLDMERRGYPLTVLHEYRMTPKSVMDTVKWIEQHDLEDLRARTGTSAARMVLVPEACRVLKQLVRSFKPRDIAVSSYGIREGMLYEQMPERLRHRDPLIEACRFAEVKDARMPGFGKALYEFIQPLFKSSGADRQRLIKAACLLHDVTWRAHPDFRAEVCFDNATRANLGGLRHRERIFLGLALLHRYKNNRDGSRFEELFEMLTEREIRDAEILGKAMRFGAMFSVKSPNEVAALKLFPQKKQLELSLTKEGDALFGEVAESRFKSLAASLDSQTYLKRKKSVKVDP